jgi:rod shape determining protein RodA
MREWLLPGLLILLAGLSVLILKSVAPSLVQAQITFFVIGAIIFYTAAQVPFSFLKQNHWLSYFGVCVFLVIPLLIGKTTRGIAGWIDIGTLFSIQPSQLAIPLISLTLATWITKYSLNTVMRLGYSLAIIGVPAVLILVEPDLGTTLIYLITLGIMLFMGGLKWSHLTVLVASALVVMILSWFFVLQPYQKARITSFVSSDQDPSGASYNAQQSLIAVGSGQLVGRGLGEGVQSHLRFLPERQTDFIFASLAEEMGFIGSLLVLGIYSSLIGTCIWASTVHPDPIGRLYCLAAASMTMIQSAINIGMNMGLFPITGITLPLLSYGGSSILAICGMYGVVWGLILKIPKRRVLDIS